MKMLKEANPGYELGFNVAYPAAIAGKWNNLLYIHSLKPEFFAIRRDLPLLHTAMEPCSARGVDFLLHRKGGIPFSGSCKVIGQRWNQPATCFHYLNRAYETLRSFIQVQ